MVDTGVTDDPAPEPARPRLDPTVKASLEDQEAFLVRSLDDIEREHAAGDLTDADHAELLGDYTERLAAVRDALVGGRGRPALSRSAEPVKRRRPGLVVLSVVGVLVFALVAGVLVARSVGRREPGQSATGLDPRGAREASAAALEECFDLDGALEADAAANCYQDYVSANPTDAEGLTYFGWFLFRVGREGGSVELLDTAAVYLDQAVEVDPRYADARALRAVTRGLTGERQGALADLEILDTLDPPPGLVELVAPIRESLVAGANPAEVDDAVPDAVPEPEATTTTAPE